MMWCGWGSNIALVYFFFSFFLFIKMMIPSPHFWFPPPFFDPNHLFSTITSCFDLSTCFWSPPSVFDNHHPFSTPSTCFQPPPPPAPVFSLNKCFFIHFYGSGVISLSLQSWQDRGWRMMAQLTQTSSGSSLSGLSFFFTTNEIISSRL